MGGGAFHCVLLTVVMLLVKHPPPAPRQCFNTTPSPVLNKSHSTACPSISLCSPQAGGGSGGVGGQGWGMGPEVASAGRRSLITRGGWQQWLVLQLLRRTLLKYPPT